ncbi:hypothetical protein ACFX1X_015238 [Malus domestica]
MTSMAMGYELLLESISEVNDSEYLIGLFSLGTLTEDMVIMGSCLGCSCSFDRVEGAAERDLALFQVVTPKVPPLVAKMFLFFALVVGTA